MKLYVYDKNIKYNESLSNFITMCIAERNELFKKYKQSEKEVEVELFASGSTCLCYKVVGNDKSKAIYKQFCPLSFEEKGYIVRRDNAVYIHDEVEIDFVKEQYDNFLRQTFNNVVGIGESYNIKEINMFVRPEIVLTNLGYMFCAEITGETLKESYNDLLSALNENKCGGVFLRESLYKTFRTLQTVKVAHENDTLILDLKSENLLNIIGDDKKEEITVRLIDFGSCINLETMESIIEQEGVENFIDQYLYSNKKYYEQFKVKTIIKNKKLVKEKAKELDLIAVKKTFCDTLFCAEKYLKSLDENLKAIQTSRMKSIVTNFFLRFSHDISFNQFEVYHIYTCIMEFLKSKNIYDSLQILANILSVLGVKCGNQPDVFWPFNIKDNDADDVIEQQKNVLLFNKNICDKFDFLKNNKNLLYVNDTKESLCFEDLYNFSLKYGCRDAGDLYFNVYKAYLIDN